jgi:arsenite methyltransferase
VTNEPLPFDEEMARQLDAAYQTADMRNRRALARGALGARPGERILDVGCGPGYYAAELLEEVGPTGSVVAVDGSPDMLAVAARRCEGRDNVAFAEADATALPVEDGDFDAALSVQVLEYVPEIDTALAEMHRALRPGGRVLVWDVDWATVSWHTADPARMERMLRIWDLHEANPTLPQTLAARLRSVGFTDVRLDAHVFASTQLAPDTYVGALFPFVEDFVLDTAEDKEEVRAWAAEQRELSEQGAFYFAVTQCCFTATKPG